MDPVSAPAPASEGGRRRSRRHHKGTRKVSARTIRSTLRKLHMRPKGRVVLKGGQINSGAGNSAPVGGRKKRASASRPRASLKRMLGL